MSERIRTLILEHVKAAMDFAFNVNYPLLG
jgi:hypothetical protein